jgi:hypothetical protein
VGNKKKIISAGLHAANFNVDEDALKISVGNMVWVAIGL